MALAETLNNPPARTNTGRSVLDDWLDTLNTNDRELVLTAARNPAWRHTDLLPALIAEGAPQVAENTFGVWRRKNGLAR